MSTDKREIKKELMKLSKSKLSALCKKHNISTATNREMINNLIPKIYAKRTKKSTETSKKTKTKTKNKPSKPINGNYLVCGFIRTIDEKEHCAYSVIEIIIQYILCMFTRFDICNEKYMQCIQNNGTIIERDVYMSTNKYKQCRKPKPMREITKIEVSTIIFGCSKGYNKGITQFKIKIDKIGTCETRLVGNPTDSIGIISDIDRISVDSEYDKNIATITGESYYLLQNSCIGTGLYASKSYKAGLNGIKVINWKDGDIVTVTMNCKKWILEFKLNGKKIGRGVDIAKKCTYHLVIYSTCNHSKYSLLTTFV
eukprot:23429_1